MVTGRVQEGGRLGTEISDLKQMGSQFLHHLLFLSEVTVGLVAMEMVEVVRFFEWRDSECPGD